MGMATAFLAMNKVYGKYWDVEEAETLEPAAVEEKWPKGEYFIIDVQTHFTNGVALSFRNAEFVKQHGLQAQERRRTPTAFTNFVKEMFFDSETSMVVISGVPGRRISASPTARSSKGSATPRPPAGPAELADVAAQEGAQRARRLPSAPSARATAPRTTTGTQTTNARPEPRSSSRWSARSRPTASTRWKWYCHTDPGRSGNGFRSTTRS